LSEVEMRAWLGFMSSRALLNRRLDQQLRRDAGLSHLQYEVLVRLSDSPAGRMRMTELADVLLHSKSGLTYQVTQLEKAGLVRREAHPGDERAVAAVLTANGRKRLEEAAPGHVATVRELFIDVLTADQVAAFAEGFSAIIRKLGEERADAVTSFDGGARAVAGG
jgi:DNA-binding MarR family transcriptional regulator